MKKKLAFLTALALSLALAAGCTGNSGDPTQEPSGTPTAEATQPPEETLSPDGPEKTDPPATDAPENGVGSGDRTDESALTFEIEGETETVDVTLKRGSFDEQDFSIYVDTAMYSFSEAGPEYSITPKNSGSADDSLTISFEAGVKADDLVSLVFEGLENRTSKDDLGTVELGKNSARQVSASDGAYSYNAYMIDTDSGVLSIVTRVSRESAEGHGVRLQAMAGTILPE